MLLRISIQPGAVRRWSDSLAIDVAQRHHRAFIKYILQFGALHFASDEERLAFEREAREVAHGTALPALWLAGRQALRDGRWGVSAGTVDLELAPPSARRRPAGNSGPERVRIGDYQVSDAYQRLEDARNSQVARAGTSRDTVWERWFSALTEHYEDVSVFDPYLANWLSKSEQPEGQRGIGACQWLIAQLAGLTTRHTLTLLTVTNATTRPDDVVESARKLLVVPLSGGLREVTVVAAARYGSTGATAMAKAVGAEVHDRHVRFSGGSRLEAALAVGGGLSRLGREPIASDVQIFFRSEVLNNPRLSIENLRATEQAVWAAQPQASTVLPRATEQ